MAEALRIIRGADGAATVWVEPFKSARPEFRVEVKRMARNEVIELADRHGLGGRRTVRLTKGAQAESDMLERTVVSWEGEESVFGRKYEHTQKGRESLFLENMVDVEDDFTDEDGEQKTRVVSENLFSYVQRVMRDQEAINLKN